MESAITTNASEIGNGTDRYADCTEENPCPYEDLTFSPGLTITFDIFYIIIIILAVIGNVLVILTVYRNKGMHTVPNVHLVNLAITDLLVAVFVMPLKLIEYGATKDVNVFADGVCSAVTYTLPIFVFAGVYTLVTLSIERYYAIVHPFRSLKINTVSRTIKLMAGIWLAAFVIPTPFLVNSKRYPIVHSSQYGLVSRLRCDNDFEEIDDQLNAPTGSFRTGFYSCLCLINFVIPTAILVYTSIRITVVLLKTRHNNHVVIRRHNSTLQRREVGKRKVAKMVVVITAAFIISWFPFYLVNILSITRAVQLANGQFYFTMLFVHLMAFVNSVVNPVIYTVMSSNFRRKCFNIISNIFCGCRHCSLLAMARSPSKLSRSGVSGVQIQTGESSLKGDQVIVNLKTFETENKDAILDPHEYSSTSNASVPEPTSPVSATTTNFTPKRFVKPTLSYSGPSDLKEYKKYLRKLSKTSMPGSVNSLTDFNEKFAFSKLSRKKKISTVSLPPGTPKLSQEDLENWRGSLNCLLDIRLADEKKVNDINNDGLHLTWDNSVDLDNSKTDEENVQSTDDKNESESKPQSIIFSTDDKNESQSKPHSIIFSNAEKPYCHSTDSQKTGNTQEFSSRMKVHGQSANSPRSDKYEVRSLKTPYLLEHKGLSSDLEGKNKTITTNMEMLEEENVTPCAKIAKRTIGKHELAGPRDSGVFSGSSATPSESGKSSPRLVSECARDQMISTSDNQASGDKSEKICEEMNTNKANNKVISHPSLNHGKEETATASVPPFATQYSRHLGSDHVFGPENGPNQIPENQQLPRGVDSAIPTPRQTYVPKIFVHSPEEPSPESAPVPEPDDRPQTRSSASLNNENIQEEQPLSSVRADETPMIQTDVDAPDSKQVKIPLRYKGYTRVDASGKPIYITVNRDVAFSTTYGFSGKYFRKRHRNHNHGQKASRFRNKNAADEEGRLPNAEKVLYSKSDSSASDMNSFSKTSQQGLNQTRFLSSGQTNPSFRYSEEDLSSISIQTERFSNGLRSRSAHDLSEQMAEESYNDYHGDIINRQASLYKGDRPNITINVILPGVSRGVGGIDGTTGDLASSQRISVSASRLLEELFAPDGALYNESNETQQFDAYTDADSPNMHRTKRGESHTPPWQISSNRRSKSSDSIHRVGLSNRMQQGAFAPVDVPKSRQTTKAVQKCLTTTKKLKQHPPGTLDIDTDVPYLASQNSSRMSRKSVNPFEKLDEEGNLARVPSALSGHGGSDGAYKVNRRKVTPVLQEAAARLQNLASNQNELCSTRSTLARKLYMNNSASFPKLNLESRPGVYTKPTEV